MISLQHLNTIHVYNEPNYLLKSIKNSEWWYFFITLHPQTFLMHGAKIFYLSLYITFFSAKNLFFNRLSQYTNKFVLPAILPYRFRRRIFRKSKWKKQISTFWFHNKKRLKYKKKVRQTVKFFSFLSGGNVAHCRAITHAFESKKAGAISKTNGYLNQKIFLNPTSVLLSITQFLYKTLTLKTDMTVKKKPAQKIFFLNMYKKVSWKMRAARYTHWNLKTRGTLNEYRYNKLLGADLQKKRDFFSKHLVQIIWAVFGPVPLKKMSALFYSGSLLLNGNFCTPYVRLTNGDIFEFPYGPLLSGANSSYIQSRAWLVAKARKFSYKHLKKKLNKVPRVFKKLADTNTLILNYTLLDILAGAGSILICPVDKQSHEWNFLNNTTLTLNNWRYRFD